jgi:hypothetical protein
MIQSGIQSLILRDVDSNMKTVSRSIERITPNIDTMKNSLSSLECTEEALLNGNLNNIENSALGLIPTDYTDLQGDLRSAINACNYLKNNPLLNDPMRLLKQISSQFMNNIFNASFGLSALPELRLSSSLLNYQGLLNQMGLGSIMSGLNSMLYCLEMQGYNISSYGDNLNSMANNLHINPMGGLDYPSLYGSAGMSNCQQNNMFNTMTRVDNVQSKVNEYSQGAMTQASIWI